MYEGYLTICSPGLGEDEVRAMLATTPAEVREYEDGGKKLKTLFWPLPKPIAFRDDLGCCCRFCSTHNRKNMVGTTGWNVLAWSPSEKRAWSVHYPELSGATALRTDP